MEIAYEELGLAIGVVIALIEIIKYLIGLFFKYINKTEDKGNKDSKHEVSIAVLQELQKIQGNDLVHIKSKIDENGEKIEKILIAMAEIKIKLDERF